MVISLLLRRRVCSLEASRGSTHLQGETHRSLLSITCSIYSELGMLDREHRAEIALERLQPACGLAEAARGKRARSSHARANPTSLLWNCTHASPISGVSADARSTESARASPPKPFSVRFAMQKPVRACALGATFPAICTEASSTHHHLRRVYLRSARSGRKSDHGRCYCPRAPYPLYEAQDNPTQRP